MTTEANNDQWKYAEKAMAWHGWGSPVGLGLFIIALAASALLVRFAALGV